MRSLLGALVAISLGAGLAGGCGGGDDDLGLPDRPPVVPEQELEPHPGGLRRILARHYVNSVRLVLGDVAAAQATPPVDATLDEFAAFAAAQLAIPESEVELYEASAIAVANAVIEDPASLDAVLPCEPTGPADAACHRAFITEVGRLLWRRPMEVDEVTTLTAIAQAAAAEYASFELGVKYALLGLLQSPYFLYMVEVGEPIEGDALGRRRLLPLELASRMSFFLLDATPDEALLSRAESGGLATAEDVREVALDLLERPEARDALAAFYSELFRLDDLGTLPKNPETFPTYTESLALSMREETLKLIEDVVWVKNGDARDIFRADYAFVNAELAGLYGVAAPPTGFQKITLPASQKRAGFLGSGAFLARFSHPNETSPTRRGAYIRGKLFCEDIPPPPPGVDITLPEPEPDNPKTMRMRLAKHLEDEACASCHKLMDPIGLSLENYDAIGAYRTKDQGLVIDPAFDETEAVGIGSIASARDLAEILATDPRGAECMIKNLYRGSMGHKESKGELPAIDELETAFAASEYRLQDLLVELVASEAFQLVAEPK